LQELDAPAAPVMTSLDQTGGHLQSRKQGRRAVPFVLVIEAGKRLAVRHPQPGLGAFRAWMCGF